MIARSLSKASASSANANEWKNLNWDSVIASVRRLQMRIAKAYREGRYGKVKALQRLLTTSYHAKLLAVRRVVQNTPRTRERVKNTDKDFKTAHEALRCMAF